MKIKHFVLLFAVSVLFAGCSKDSISPTGAANSHDNEPSNTIEEDQTLVDPLNKADVVEVVGKIRFAIVQIPILSRNEVQASITFNGQVYSSLIDGPEGWQVSGTSEGNVDLGLKGSARIERTYAIPNYFEPLSLHIAYTVTDAQLQVDRILLDSAERDVASR